MMIQNSSPKRTSAKMSSQGPALGPAGTRGWMRTREGLKAQRRKCLLTWAMLRQGGKVS